MEPVTHMLTGACLGRSGFNRKTAYATLAAVLAAEAPDLDMVSFLGGPVSEFAHHRALTHSFIGAPFMALGVTGFIWFVDRLRRRRKRAPELPPVRWGWIYLIACIADLSHLLLDFTNSYGIRPLVPFDPHWFAWSIMPLFSPLLFAVLVLGLCMPALLGLVDNEMRRPERGALRGRGWAIAALCGVGLLYTICSVSHAMAVSLVRANSETAPLRVAADPSTWSPFAWDTVADFGTSYRTGTANTLRGSYAPVDTIVKPSPDAAASVAANTFLGRSYLAWSSWPLVEDLGSDPPPGSNAVLPPGAHTVQFSDLRYQSPTGEKVPGLTGYVVVTSDDGLVGQWLGGTEQR